MRITHITHLTRITVLAFAYVSQDASLQPIEQCSAATNVHHLHPCHVPNQYQESCLRHKIEHKSWPHG